jgi:S-phase kinase-associated protein 1
VSKMLSDIIEGQEDEEIGKDDIMLPNVSKVELKRVVEFCTHYKEEKMNDIVVKGKEKLEKIITQDWYLEFIKNLSRDELFALISAADYLVILPLMNLSVLGFTALIHNKSQDEIREIFNITKSETSGNAEGKEEE